MIYSAALPCLKKDWMKFSIYNLLFIIYKNDIDLYLYMHNVFISGSEISCSRHHVLSQVSQQFSHFHLNAQQSVLYTTASR